MSLSVFFCRLVYDAIFVMNGRNRCSVSTDTIYSADLT